MMSWGKLHRSRSVVMVLRGVWYAALIWGIFFGLLAKHQPLQYWGM